MTSTAELSLEAQRQAVTEVKTELCENDIIKFVSLYLKEELPLRIPPFHQEIYKQLAGSLKRLCIISPTGFGKSSVVAFAYPVWLACYAKARRIILISSTSTFAERKLRDIKQVFETNEMIMTEFGICKSDTWTNSEIILNNGVQILALGKGSQITGERPDVIICDDIETEKEAKSEVERASLDYWWFASVMNRPNEPDGKIVLIGSISHKLAFLNRNFNNDEAKKVWSVSKYVTKDNKTIWSDKWSDEALRRKEIELAPFPGIYAALYEADVSQIQRYAFKRDWLRFYEVVPKGLNVFTAVDPAIGEAIHNDYTAIVTVGISVTGDIYILDVIKKRFNLDALELFGALFSVYDVFHPAKIGIESIGFQKFIKIFFEQEMRKRGKFPNILEIKHDTQRTKEARITSLAPSFQAGQIYIRQDMYDLVAEYDAYPEVEHDDVLDALSMVKDMSVPRAFTNNKGLIPRYKPTNSAINF
jgi:predicted phage terminase large subunit-like protein